MRAPRLRPVRLALVILLASLLGGLNAPATAQSAAAATFVGADTTTQGNWKGVYGGDGYNISQDTANNPQLPAYAAAAAVTGNYNYVWAASTTDARALLKAATTGTDRLGACWFTSGGYGTSFDVDVPITDGQAHRVSLYFLDWERRGRIESVAVRDATGATLSAQTLQSCTEGTYLTWLVQGHVIFRVTCANPPGDFNAVLSGLFFSHTSSLPAPYIPPPGWAEDVMPADDASDADGMGPAAASAVNLASGVEENSPGPDLWAYNPVGPSASYERRYRSARAQQGYASPGLSLGWTDGYDLSVVPTGSGYTLTYDNGGQDQWTGTTGSLGTPAGAPYLVSASGTTLTMTFKDRSKYVFTQVGAAGGNYPANSYLLTGISNLVGHTITLNRDSAANGYRLLSITNDASPVAALLTFAYLNGSLYTVTDNNSRQITYGFNGGLLGSVSQITAPNPSNPPARWQYDYTPVLGVALLATVHAPDPSNPGGMAAAVTTYDPATGAVSQHQDASLRVHSYGYSGSQTTVQVNNVGGGLAETWTQKQNAGGAGKNADTGTTDAAGKSGSVSYAGTPSPYLPSAATNRNGQSTQVTYNDAFGNVLTTTSPRGVVTTFGYANPGDFALNQVATVTQSIPATGEAKQPTRFTYYGPSDGVLNGLLKTVASPLPDTTTASPGNPVTTAYGYDGLGNVTQTTGPNADGTATVTYNYTSDGTVTQTEALGQPLSVTVSGPDINNVTTTTVTHYRYDARGNRIAAIDALGNETDSYYNLADQLQAVVAPSTVGSPSQRAFTYTTYQYLGGPEAGTQVFAEGAVTSFPAPGALFPAPAASTFRQVSDFYDPDGELLRVVGDTHPVVYAYDGRGRVRTVTYFQDANNPMFGRTTTYSYDTVGNLAAVSYPGASGQTFDQTRYTYDADGNVATETSGVGVTKTYARVDPESQLTGISYGYPAGYNGTQIGPVTLGYDHWGRRAAMSNDATVMAYTYDDLDELQAATTDFRHSRGPAGRSLAYGHYQDGSRAYWQANGGSYQAYEYDGVGRTTADYLVSEHVYGSFYGYLANGWLSQTQSFYGSSTSSGVTPFLQADRTYSPRGFLTGLTNSLLAVPAFRIQATRLSAFTGMAYDASGNRLTETATVPALGRATNLSRTLTYGYDRLDQLTQEVSQATSGTTSLNYTNLFSYDPAGNPTSARLKGSGFNSDNQNAATLLANGVSAPITYDGDGDPLALPYGSTTYPTTFDPEDRLTVAVQGFLNAGYDGDGLRAWSLNGPGYPVTGQPTYYLGDGDRAVEEVAADSEDLFYSVFGASGLEGRSREYAGAGGDTSQIAYSAYTYDPQGSLVQPVSLYPDAGPVVRVETSSAYDAFGWGTTVAAGVRGTSTAQSASGGSTGTTGTIRGCTS